MNDHTSEKSAKLNAIFSIILGLVSIFGLIFVNEGTLLSIAGLIWGVMSLQETQFKQIDKKLAFVGIIFNLIGFIGLISLAI